MAAIDGTAASRATASSPWLIWLSRWRINVAMLAAAPALWLARPTTDSIVAFLPLLIAGAVLRVWARGHLERQTRVTWNGPYAWVRHPLYVGSFLMGFAFCGMTRLPLLMVAYVPVYVAMYWPKAVREERWMLQRFGVQYAAYAARTGAVFPHLRWSGPAFVLPEPTRFAWRRVRRHREWKTWIGMIALVAVLVVRALA